MKHILFALSMGWLAMTAVSCKKEGAPAQQGSSEAPGLKIAYVNGDSILLHFTAFRKESENLEARQRKAEEDLQTKGAALEREIIAYQQKAQSGTMTGKEMEAREKYLAGRQEALFAERDKMAKEILEETEVINNRLHEVLHGVLDTLRKTEGYDFIFSYVQGGQILSADARYDITARVLKMLNERSGLPSGTGDAQ